MMKRVFIGAIVMVLCGLILTGCGGGLFNVGATETRDFNVADFHSINVSFPFEIVWTESDQTSVTVTAGQNVFNRLRVETRQGVLTVSDRNRFGSINIGRNNRPRLYISSPTLESVRVSGATSISSRDTITGNDFELRASGSTSANLNLDVRNLNVNLSGSSNITLSGRADNTDFNASGSSSISAFNLHSVNAELRISGSGDADINVSDTINARLSGSSRVVYMGTPRVTQNTSGSSSIRQAN